MTAAGLLLVALGGAAGAAARVWLSGLVERRAGAALPWATLAVNVSGALLLGLLSALLSPGAPWLLLAVGALGSYTTVSAVSLQLLDLPRGRAGAYLVLSVSLCLLAVLLGRAVGRALA